MLDDAQPALPAPLLGVRTPAGGAHPASGPARPPSDLDTAAPDGRHRSAVSERLPGDRDRLAAGGRGRRRSAQAVSRDHGRARHRQDLHDRRASSTVLRRTAGQERRLRVLLAAPTGKAAARLQESLRPGRPARPPAARSARQEVHTLHRLLQPVPGTPCFRHDREQPLPADADGRRRGLHGGPGAHGQAGGRGPARTARLVLVGDRRPARVGRGRFGSGRHLRPRPARLLAEFGRRSGATGEAVPPAAAAGRCRTASSSCRRSHRFAAGSAIGELSRAVNARRCRRRARDPGARPETDRSSWLDPAAGAGAARPIWQRDLRRATRPAGRSGRPGRGAAGARPVQDPLRPRAAAPTGWRRSTALAERMLVRAGPDPDRRAAAAPGTPAGPCSITQQRLRASGFSTATSG
ncbi:MAG: hypothetical protein MZV70_67740 [Desulfobacterales bacterium]|nr:hypothetical protein [Desulfobacterales bacterium]